VKSLIKPSETLLIKIKPNLHSGAKSSIIGTTYYRGGLQYGGQKSRKI
jgi:hypothetical protein